MNKFEKALDRIKKNVEVQDSWTDEDFEHYETVVAALEVASDLCESITITTKEGSRII